MSYPRLIQPLVIEDDVISKTSYDDLFARLRKVHPVAHPRYAFSYEEAQLALEGSEIFHLVVLDLCLPERPGMPPSGDISLGMDLLNVISGRTTYPVPVAVVVSGNLNRVKSELTDALRDGFFYGKAANKGVDEEAVLEEAVLNACRYLDVGIHMRDVPGKLFPTVSPREEDLLRRCVLEQPKAVGLDLRWWSAEADNQGRWTKVLMGLFVHDDGAIGYSRPNFFKFSPAEDAQYVIPEAARLEHKLGHIKLIHSRISKPTSLLVTQKVGDGTDTPTPLADFLTKPAGFVAVHLPGIVGDIGRQLELLGPSVPDNIARRDLLWNAFHDRTKIEQAWERWGACLSGGSGPLQVYDRLTQDQSRVTVSLRHFTHGDLNITNVALDETPSGVHAYIFDASGIRRQVNVRDIAMLEVTALLHHARPYAVDLVRANESLYAETVSVPDDLPLPQDDLAANTAELIRNLRKRALEISSSLVYAVTLFDVALCQLEGLMYASGSLNKIGVPENAALLCKIISAWLARLDPSVADGA